MLDQVESLRLTDHHCHGVTRSDLDLSGFTALLAEGPGGPGALDSQLGFALRRWCPPVLGLAPHAPAEVYLDRRAELGMAEVNRRFLSGAGLDALCVDTGFMPEKLTSVRELGDLAGAPAFEIVRLEAEAEEVMARGVRAAGFADAVRERLAMRTRDAVAVKSIAAYRAGLELSGERPSDAEVTAAAGRLLAATPEGVRPRLADETLHRFLIWCGADLGLPVQFHVGYGDRDLDLHRADPLLLTGLLRALEPTGVPVMLLHNYPFHRSAGYLAQVFPHVFVDVGLATHGVGARAGTLLAEILELAPFGKLLYSSDAYGLPEHHFLAARLFRRAVAGFLAEGVAGNAWTAADADRIARLLTSANARRIYRL